MARQLWRSLTEAESLRLYGYGQQLEVAYGICVRCAGYQMLRTSGLCYDCLPGQILGSRGTYRQEPWNEVVYYCAREGLIKIGTSTKAYTRTYQLGAQLLATEGGGTAVEHDRHRKFADCNATHEASRMGLPNPTEWFRSAPELLAHIKTLRRPHQRVSHRG